MEIKNELQDILGELIREEVSTIDMLRNNAKAMGGVLGAEQVYL